MKFLRPHLFTACLVCYALTGFCWGGEGHKQIGNIAYHYLNAGTKDSLKYYLDTVTLARAGTWMDEMRKDHHYDYMKPWHYIDFAKGETYTSSPPENVISELNKRIEHLKHRNLYSKEQVTTDLKILIHLTEDLHQPLHVGYPADTGGNAIHLTFMSHPTTLHWAWDNDIMLQQNITLDSCLALLHTFSKKELEQKRKTDILLWMNESRSYLGQVYDYTGNSLDVAYAEKNAPLIKLRLSLAGLRLAEMLNTLFAK